MKSRFLTTLGVFLLLIAAGCASNPSSSVSLEDKLAQRGFVIGPQVKKVINLQVSSWNSIDERHVIMNFGASRSYLLTLRTSCDSLLGEAVIGFSTTVGSLTENDKLLVRDSSQRVANCLIKTIHELEKTGKTG
jgi:hypothetical protein